MLISLLDVYIVVTPSDVKLCEYVGSTKACCEVRYEG